MEASGVFRTPDDRFAALPDFAYEPKYIESDGLRVAYIDEGDGPIVFLLHGMPSWSFLWRHVIPPLLEAGYRCVVPDLIGFGRSDKPTAVADYTYPRHVAAVVAVLDEVAPSTPVHFVMHDWGGPIGSLVATNNQDRIASTTMMDTGFNTGDFKMSENWQTFRDFVANAEELPIAFLVKGAVAREMTDDVFAAYEAPFPTEESKAGARAFPPMIPTSEDHPDAIEGRRALEAFAAGEWPKLVLWADKDPVLPRRLGDVLADRIGAGSAITIENAGHFLQEDAGAEIGERIANFLTVSAS
jgi:haloalkane dehalogenase